MMNTLSLERINRSAPYAVTEGDTLGTFRFFTKKGVHYAVDFVPDDLIETGESFQLIIANLNNVKSPRDTKVRDSILAIVDEFFNKNQSTLLYICETGDGKQGIRSRLFEYWFETYRYKALFTMLTSSVVDEEGIVNFATLILRNDNPLLAEVVAEFSESVQLLSQKPE